MEKPIIEIKNLNKAFQDEQILRSINLSFMPGKIYGVVGKNGSGKSMLLKCICGLVVPTSGEIIVEGKIVGRDVDFPENVGLTIDASGFLPYYSGIKNLNILASIRNLADRKMIDKSIQRVGMEKYAKKMYGKYSTGMKQRLAIAQAIMENPSLLLLDEPLNGLDEEGINDVRALFRELKGEGKTIIMATHSKEDIDNLCDVIIEMSKGEASVKNYPT